MTTEYIVVLAGGSGTRFWPRSRHKKPKQLCTLGGGSLSMIQKTFERIDSYVPLDRRIVVTHQDQLQDTRANLAQRCELFLSEPEARNTANALALAALEIYRRDPRGIMVSLHADHVIANEAKFLEDIKVAVEVAKQGQLALIGISPRTPETGYGYIQIGDEIAGSNKKAYRVNSFKEKPDFKTAESYLEDGGYLWNSGLFVWQVATLLEELRRFLPEAMGIWDQELLAKDRSWNDLNRDEQRDVYQRLPKIAIDNAVLEKSNLVSVVKSDFGWYDIGSWSSLGECYGTNAEGNYLSGDVLTIDTHGCTLETDGPLIATIGVKDLVVVSTGDAILVCPKDRSQDVKEIVAALKAKNRHELT